MFPDACVLQATPTVSHISLQRQKSALSGHLLERVAASAEHFGGWY